MVQSVLRSGLFMVLVGLAPVFKTYAQPGERTEPLPKHLEGVGITEKLGSKIPEDLKFTTSDGKPVNIGSLLQGERPVLLTMNYSDCPMLCSVQLNGFVESMKAMQWKVGKEFEVITVSLDPNEAPERAQQTKERYVRDYGDPEAAKGWHFLVGAEDQVRALADAVGFGYRYHDERKEYLHAAAIMVLSPSGSVSRYLYGVAYSPQTMRLSMVEASEGKQVSTLDAIVLYCFYYNADEGSYTPTVRNIMKLGGAVTVLILAAFVGAGMGLRRKKRSSPKVPANGVA